MWTLSYYSVCVCANFVTARFVDSREAVVIVVGSAPYGKLCPLLEQFSAHGFTLHVLYPV
jgi:hypothetical protein